MFLRGLKTINFYYQTSNFCSYFHVGYNIKLSDDTDAVGSWTTFWIAQMENRGHYCPSIHENLWNLCPKKCIQYLLGIIIIYTIYYIFIIDKYILGFPGGSVVKNLSVNAWDTGLISGLGRSPGGGNGNPLQYSCLGNPRDRGAQWATVHGSQRVGQDLVTEQQHIYAMEYQCNNNHHFFFLAVLLVDSHSRNL